MKIRLANKEDLKAIEQIYENARQFMRSNGNFSQWGNSYPSVGIIQADIKQKCLYVVEDEAIQAVFTLIMGEVQMSITFFTGTVSSFFRSMVRSFF